jgi:multidrug efflux pump
MPKFFIDRPIFAWVLSLLIMLAGILAIKRINVAEKKKD